MAAPRLAGVARQPRKYPVFSVLLLLAGFIFAAAEPSAGAASTRQPAIPSAIEWAATPFLQESPPIENRIRLMVRDLLREIRRAVKLSRYYITSGPAWWWDRAKHAVWPMAFALSALFFDAALLAEWKGDGLRVLLNYVPMMLYVYGRLFVSSGTSVVVRIGIVLAFAYGVWIDDFIHDGRWYSLNKGKIDDFVLITGAVRAFVVSCPEHLVELYAERAIALRGRLSRALRRSG